MTKENIEALKTKGFYRWLGEEGILIDHEIDGVKAYAESDDGKYFYPFSLLPDGDYEPLAAYDDEYANLKGQGDEIVCDRIVNPGNDQRLLPYFFVCENFYKDDLYNRQLKTETNSYYDWTSDRSKFIDRYTSEEYRDMNSKDFEKEKAAAKKEWDEIVAQYTSSCFDSPDFEELWKEIEYINFR